MYQPLVFSMTLADMWMLVEDKVNLVEAANYLGINSNE